MITDTIDKLQTEKLLSKVPNRFVLAVGTARRARQLFDGANLLIPGTSKKQSVLAALLEIQENKVAIEMESSTEDDLEE